MITKSVGELDSSDIGRKLTIKDGGATYEGVITSIQHNERDRTYISIVNGEWRHGSFYDANKLCEVRGEQHG